MSEVTLELETGTKNRMLLLTHALTVVILQCSVLLSRRQQFKYGAPCIGAVKTQTPWDAFHLKQAVGAH